MTDFTQLIKERRSASNFLPGYKITQPELEEIFELTKLAPSAFNLQHTNYIAVTDHNLKEKVRGAANGQYKVSSASAVILVLGDRKAVQQAPKIYEGLEMLGIVNRQEYEDMVRDTVSFYDTRGQEFEKDEAIRNASLSAMLFMLAAKDKGWDTCPMIGFEPAALKNIFHIDDRYEAVLMIALGKEKVQSRQPRGYRKPVSEFVTFL
ncbi:nitroreductase family protein [Bacillus massiliglaciei]|uniref:nitroreductase family protein n=1 Tax=Bacillus massiliglaciei TaxID=1816693 RepID=UPI000A7226F0|nr:nitroreductase family protein [Bacillus massiliglaciei]